MLHDVEGEQAPLAQLEKMSFAAQNHVKPARHENYLLKMSFAARNHVKPARHENDFGSLLTKTSKQTLSHCGLEMITPGTISSQGDQSILNT